MSVMFICGACNGPHARHLGARDGYDIFKCDFCHYQWRPDPLGHIRTRIGAPSEADTYRGTWYHDALPHEKGEADFVERWNHDYAVALVRLAKISEAGHGPGPNASRVSLLDIGCSNGAFVAAAMDRGYRAFGSDLDEVLLEKMAAAHPQLNGHLICHPGIPPGGGWSVITAHDVLEHVRDVHGILREITKAMARNGLLVVETPDPACPEAIATGADFRHTKPREHLHLIPATVWHELFTAVGLEFVGAWTTVPTKLGVMARKSTACRDGRP